MGSGGIIDWESEGKEIQDPPISLFFGLFQFFLLLFCFLVNLFWTLQQSRYFMLILAAIYGQSSGLSRKTVAIPDTSP